MTHPLTLESRRAVSSACCVLAAALRAHGYDRSELCRRRPGHYFHRELWYGMTGDVRGCITTRPHSRDPFTVRITVGLRRTPDTLELTCLLGELEALAVWVADWIKAHERGGGAPPAPVAVVAPAAELPTYVWTSTAMEAYIEARRAGSGQRGAA